VIKVLESMASAHTLEFATDEENRGHGDAIVTLQAKITNLAGQLKHFANPSDLEELLIIIHRPGWTTPAEFAFVSAIVDSIQGHITSLTHLRKSLLSGSRAVGSKHGELS
jgi:hypothetical protein